MAPDDAERSKASFARRANVRSTFTAVALPFRMTAALVRASDSGKPRPYLRPHNAQLGPRPFFLIEDVADGDMGFGLQAVDSVIHRKGNLMAMPDVLAQDVRIPGIFNGWEATATYYGNCKGL